MSVRYHVNQNTGKYGRCEATVKDCPLGDIAIHLEKLEDAVKYSEMIFEEKYGTPALKKKQVPSAGAIALSINKRYPYPEAHKLSKIDKVVSGLRSGEVPPSAISSLIGTKDRVSDFYAEAACFLGLAEAVVDQKGNKAFSLTSTGSDYVKQNKKGREDILTRAVSNIDLVQQINNDDDKENMLQKISETHGESLNTSDRKLSSMRSWAKQIREGDFLEEIDAEEVSEKLSEGMELYNRKQADNVEPVVKKQGELCMSCFMTKPLTGICPNCDE